MYASKSKEPLQVTKVRVDISSHRQPTSKEIDKDVARVIEELMKDRTSQNEEFDEDDASEIEESDEDDASQIEEVHETYTYQIREEILADDQDGNEVELGYIVADVVKFNRMLEEGLDWRGICDAHSEELDQLAKALSNKKAELLDPDPLLWPEEICFIKMVRVYEQYRGHGIGLFAVDQFVTKLFKFADWVVLSPGPALDVRMGAKETERITDKLTEHWSLIGFQTCPPTPNVDKLMRLRRADARPDIEEVVQWADAWRTS